MTDLVRRAIGLIKFPTASRAAGLGTGEFDFGVESAFFWSAGKFTPYATIGYRFLGSPPGTDLDDVLLGSIGGPPSRAVKTAATDFPLSPV